MVDFLGISNNENIYFNVKLVGRIMRYITRGEWEPDFACDIELQFISFSKALYYITSLDMRDVQELLFSKFKMLEIYLANDRLGVNQEITKPFKIAVHAMEILRRQTRVLSPDELHDALIESGLTDKRTFTVDLCELSVRKHYLYNLFTDKALFSKKRHIDSDTKFNLVVGFPELAVIGTRPSTLQQSCQFEFIVPCKMEQAESVSEKDDVEIQLIVISSSNSPRILIDILQLMYPDITDEQWKEIKKELI